MEFKAYHGTLHKNIKNILTSGLYHSAGNEHWLGDGVYFFVEGVGYDPIKAAELWAEFRAYKSGEQFCSLMEVTIDVEESELLDLTTYDGIRILNYMQRRCAQKLATIGKGVGLCCLGHISDKGYEDY